MPDPAQSPLRIKICGLSTAETIAASVEAGASYIGFVFFERSPRNVTPKRAAELSADVPPGVAKVGLIVDPSDDTLDAILSNVSLDMIQLHGSESPDRVLEVKTRTGLPAMKAVGISSAEDLSRLPPYEQVADQILVDTKAPKGSDLPGGNGLSFDWSLISGRRWPIPWMLAGGLTVDTVAAAIQQTGARQLDLSSGVERAPGVKDPEKIRAFITAAQAAVPTS
ncbi:phosphoribosylanthranilate isomerase [Aestuariibius insulae]|uniref:phosphoribosylanthranilate isomerase n=1 Tax=Aestuariibius insulae TaxID=2058287 RepID=UPI00345E7515